MWASVSEEAALATVHADFDQGVRYFDTAPLCGVGKGTRASRGCGTPAMRRFGTLYLLSRQDAVEKARASTHTGTKPPRTGAPGT